jgi:hypothetical protein
LPPPAGGSAETQTESCRWSDNGTVNNAEALEPYLAPHARSAED